MRHLAAVLAACAFLPIACAYDRDAFYEPAERMALPLLPFVPDDERIDACTTCAAEKCAAEREACVADAECAELLGCRGECADPACLSMCGDRAYIDVLGLRTEALGTFGRYQACAATTKCASECGWGRNWGCQGRYASPAAEDPIDIPVQLELVSVALRLGVSGSVVPCADDGVCLHAPIASDDWGQVETNAGRRDALARGSGFDGFFEVESGRWRYLFYAGLPLTRSTRLVLPLTYGIPSGVTYELQTQRSASDTPPPRLGIVWLAATDCLGAAAPGVTFEIETDSAHGPTFYIVAGGARASAAATQTESPLPIGGIADVEPGRATVRARRVDTMGVVASRHDVVVRAGWQVTTTLRPASGSE